MLVKTLTVGVLVTTFLFYFWRVDRFQFIPLSTNFHLLGTSIFTFGTIFLVDASNNEELGWMLYVSVSFLFLLLGIVVSSLLLNFNAVKEIRALRQKEWPRAANADISFLLIMSIVALGASITFYLIIGNIVPVSAIISLMSGESLPDVGLEYVQARKSIHYSASGGYYGVGYFSQFTNVLLPLTWVVLVFITKGQRTKFLSIYIFTLLIFSVLAMTGTGRRGVIIGFLIFLILWSGWKGLGSYRYSSKAKLWLVIGTVLLMGVLTTLMARSVASASVWGNMLYGIWFLIERIALHPPAQELRIFKIFLSSQEPVYGYGWLVQLNDILPGHIPGLAQQMHSMLGGSVHGSAGFSPFGEKYYNFGWFGATFVSFVWGCFIQIFQIQVIRFKSKGLVWIVMCYAAYLLGMSGAPIDLFSQGFIACLIFIGCYQAFKIVRNSLPKKVTRK